MSAAQRRAGHQARSHEGIEDLSEGVGVVRQESERA